MKFGQLMVYNKNNILIEKACRYSSRETSSRLPFVFKIALDEVKASSIL